MTATDNYDNLCLKQITYNKLFLHFNAKVKSDPSSYTCYIVLLEIIGKISQNPGMGFQHNLHPQIPEKIVSRRVNAS